MREEERCIGRYGEGKGERDVKGRRESKEEKEQREEVFGRAR
jgi:hypothetical protein